MKWKKKHSPYEACIGKADKVKYKREKLKEFLFMNLDVVILNRILANWIKEDIKKNNTYYHVRVIPGTQGWFWY